MRGIALRWIGLILAALTYVMMLITPGTGYTIGDPEYLRIFTKKYHQVWTQILSQGGYREPNFEALRNYKPNDGTESVFIQGVSPKPRHFHSAQFFNGSMYVFGGLDKDMYYNDIWEYKLPLFASDRSKWYEQISYWERDLQWLATYNNRYTHNIVRDIYTSVCKDQYDQKDAESQSRTWEMATEGLTINDPDGGPPEAVPAIQTGHFQNPDIVLAPGQQYSPITGRGPVYTALPSTGTDPLGEQQWEWLAEEGRWVCEEMKLRFDFMNTPSIELIQDKKRPSSRFAAGTEFVYTDVLFTPETSTKICDLYGCKTTVFDPIWAAEPTTGEMYSRLVNVDRRTMKRVYPHGSDLNTCLWNSADWGKTYIKAGYGTFEYSVPPGCRPQIIMFGGYDVNDLFLNDIWFYDIWNNSWSTTIVAPHNHTVGAPPSYPRARRFASVNMVRYDEPFKPAGSQVPDVHQNYTEMLYVMGGESAFPSGVFQDCWGYSREYNQWIDLRPIGRVPSARVYDTIDFARDTYAAPDGQITGYLIGGIFGGFKIDVMRYNLHKNRFSQLYALGAKPSARSYFSTSLYKDTIFVFGGRGWKLVDNIDKDDMWTYNITTNSWARAEPTGVIPLNRWGHSAIAFDRTLFVFGGYSTPELQELGTGDMNDVWRFDIILGALLADNKFEQNAGGWTIYQNEVRGDTIIPWHCEDFASQFGDYQGMPCRIAYEGSTQQILFVDGLHNDTNNEDCALMGCNGVGYLSAPQNYVRIGKKMYQGRFRYEYTKVFPNEEGNRQYDEVCETLFLNSTQNPTINASNTLPCGDLELYMNGTYSEAEACPMRIAFFACVKTKGCMDLSRNFICTDALKNCNIDGGVLCAQRRDAAYDTKDDILLVGKYAVLSFDILDELVPYPRRYTLVDVDLDEQKGWRIHGTNGTLIPTREEFLSVLETLQLILVRADYWASIYFKDNTNYDYLGLIKEPATRVTTGGQTVTPDMDDYIIPDVNSYFNNTHKGTEHNLTHKLGQDGSIHEYGELPDRVGTFDKDRPNEENWQGEGLWKFYVQPDSTETMKPFGRRQTHGEIVGVRSFELFESPVPRFD